MAKARTSHPAPLSEHDYQLLADFRFELREFLHFSEMAAYDAGLHPQQHQALLVVRGSRHPEVTVGEIALRLKVKPHTAVELINRMAAEGLVRKVADPQDGRRVLLQLTPRSERLLNKLSSAHKTELARVGPALEEILTHLRVL
jgi:DNA-binding MarR family transcriptional regulator